MMKRIFLLAAVAAALSAEAGWEWTNVKPESRIGGRMISVGYLKGKVVLLDHRDYGDEKEFPAIQRLQAIWATYKTKPFVLVGSHYGKHDRERVEKVMKKFGVTFPVYDDVRLMKTDWSDEDRASMKQTYESGKPLLMVMDSTCTKRLYYGYDDRSATGVIGSAIMGASRPMAPKQWDYLLKWETNNLPGKAYVRLKDYRAQYPRDAAKFDAFWAKCKDSDELNQLAKLVELSRLVKDRDTNSASAKKITPEVLEKAIEKYSPLKQSEDPAVSQEAKNALADIKWSASSL